MKLYQLPAAFTDIDLMTQDGELPPEAMEKLAALEMELGQKLDACCRVMRRFEAQAAAYKNEADRFAKHATSATNNAARIKKYMEDNLKALGIDKIETELFRLRLQNNAPSCEIVAGFDLRTLPEEYQSIKIDANKRALLQAHKDGVLLPEGVSIVQTRTLRVS